MSNESHGRRLAPAPKNLRESAIVRTAPITRAIAERRMRVAFCELFHDAPRKPAFIHELQRRDQRVPLPDQRQRALIHDGIRSGMISRERIVRYRATQLLDDLAAFPTAAPANERLLALVMREIGEAAESAIVAESVPSGENRMRAIRESKDAVAALELHAATLERETVS